MQILQDAGYRVLTAHSPEEALDRMAKEQVHVVLTDVMFPNGESGVDLVGAIRQRHPNTQVVAMTGSRDAAIREELMGKGAGAMMSKPLELSQILLVIERACRGGGRSLLLVDDDPMVRKLLSKMFTTEEYRVRAVGSVAEALNAVNEEVPDVIVCDKNLDGESGFDLLTPVADRYPNLPFIMLTATPDLESSSQAYRMRVFDYVVKSSDFALLRRAVKQAVFFGVKSGRNPLISAH
jgi:DNA-binding NtrC family response regulator